MADEFNFEITTKYKPEFKSLVTYDKLYERLAEERIKNEDIKPKKNEDYIERMREIVSGKDKSSIKNKLKNQLHLDIKKYDIKSNEEKFNVLKLLRFIVKSNRYEQDSDSVLKTVSVINLIAKPSLDHTDFANSVYEKHFRSIIEEIRPAVNDANYREETVDRIHCLWEKIHTTIDSTVLEDIQTHQNALQTINQRLKYILDCLDVKKIAKIQRPNEGIIDTFYNILISSRIIAEIEDMKKVVYTYQKEKTVPKVITDVFLNKIFSETVTWKEFRRMIDKKKVDITDRKIQMVWSLILCKENVTNEDLKGINGSDYNFAIKYAEIIAEYWIKEELQHVTVTLGEWIIVMQELMYIKHEKIKYKNSYIRRTNTNAKLTASIKKFEEKSQLPHLLVLKRLTHRLLLIFGTKELFDQKLQADRYIMEIEKIIFSYKNVEDIKTAHNLLYYQVISSLATNLSKFDIPEKVNRIIQSKMVEFNLPPYVLITEPQSQLIFEILMNVLVQDKNFKLLNDDVFMKYRQEVLKALLNGTVEGLNFVANNKLTSHPEFAYETMSNMIAEEIKRIYDNFPSDNLPGTYSQTLTVPIYFGEGNEYNLYINFALLYQFNLIVLSRIGFMGKEIDSLDRYRELLLVK